MLPSPFLITFVIKGITAGLEFIVFATSPYVGALTHSDIGTPEISQVGAFAASLRASHHRNGSGVSFLNGSIGRSRKVGWTGFSG